MSLKGSSCLEPLVPSGKSLQAITVPESDADRCSTATPTTASKLTNCHEIRSASDAPLSSFRQQPEVLASSCHTGTVSQVQNSLSVSEVIDELHLSSIEWDALSFTAAPSPQSQHCKPDPQPGNKSDEGTKMEVRGSSTGESAAPQADGLSVCSLMERVHLRNMMKCSGSQNNEQKESKVVASELKYTLGLGHKPLSENPKVPSQSRFQKSELSTINTVTPDSKEKTFAKTQQPKDSFPVLVPPKYEFVKPKHFNRTSNDPEQTHKESACKKSVCKRQGSSSDDSDVENQPLTKQQHKLKANVKPKPQIVQKTVLAKQLGKQDRCSMFPNSVDTHHRSDSTTPEKQPRNTNSRTNPITQTCSTKSDDDSDASICSPLPLVERLKLKFNK